MGLVAGFMIQLPTRFPEDPILLREGKDQGSSRSENVAKDAGPGYATTQAQTIAGNLKGRPALFFCFP